MTCVETGSGLRPMARATCASIARIDIGEGSDRPGNGAGGDFLAGAYQALACAGKLGIGIGKLHPEGRGLGMNAVAAADGERVAMLEGAALQGLEQLIEIGEQEIAGAGKLHAETGVEHVG